MSSNIAFVGGGAMQCEYCRSNFANYKFSDSHLDEGATKVVCPGCFHVLSLCCIRQDLSILHKKIETIERSVGADSEGASQSG